MVTSIVLIEDTLVDSDIENITTLHGDEPLTVHVLVPADTERSVVKEFIDALSLLDLREAWDSITDPETPDEARAEADKALAGTLTKFRAAGVTADGEVVADDPLPALKQALANLHADEIIVVTQPHAVEDTFHTDWASRARDDLGVPVLHFYTGTDLIG